MRRFVGALGGAFVLVHIFGAQVAGATPTLSVFGPDLPVTIRGQAGTAIAGSFRIVAAGGDATILAAFPSAFAQADHPTRTIPADKVEVTTPPNPIGISPQPVTLSVPVVTDPGTYTG